MTGVHALLLAALLLVPVAAAQGTMEQGTTAQAATAHGTAAQGTPAPDTQPPGTASPAAPTELQGLLQAMRRSRYQALQGEVRTEVRFPPRPDPVGTQQSLPQVEFVPYLIERNFDVTSAGARVAGRAAVRFDLKPRHAGASSWSVWVDARWHLPLAFEERGPGGRRLRAARHVTVTGGPVARPEQSPAPRLTRAQLLRALPGLRFPPGFEPLGVRSGAHGPELLLSDGANLLVLVAAEQDVRPGEGVAVRRVGSRYLWLVGTLPRAQLKTVLEGVRDVRLATLEERGAQQGSGQ